MITEKNIDENFESILFLGDIHGDFYSISWYLKQKKLKNVLIIQVGDFGIGFKKEEIYDLRRVNSELEKRNSKLVAIRGNHDNPVYFEEDKYKFSNIHFLKDYTILNLTINSIKQIKILCIGGAISIDRKVRTKNISYWENEGMNFITDEKELEKIKDINAIVTHTSPDFSSPFGFNSLVYSFAGSDKTLLDDLIMERKKLSEMMKIIFENNKESLKYYFHGHFHMSNTFYYQDIKIECLSIEQFYSILTFY